MNILDQDLQYLRGVGAARAKVLASEWDMRTWGELLRVLPVRYVDRTKTYTIDSLRDDMSHVQLRGRILSFELVGEGRKQRLTAAFTDGTGYMELVWFNAVRGVQRSLKAGAEYLVMGKPAAWNGRISMAHPELELIGDRQGAAQPCVMKPYYRITERMKRHGFTSSLVGRLVETILQAAPHPAETLPASIVASQRLMDLGTALRTLHFPASAAELPEALRRVKFEELFYLQLSILRVARRRSQRTGGYVFRRIGPAFTEFYYQRLPFPLTEAQKRVLREVRADVGSGRHMNRLVQGDVGSGKTIVALMACLMAVDNGYQACIMAPTEILAEQHYRSFSRLLEGTAVRVELLTGSVHGRRRTTLLHDVASGEVSILVGTHALVEDSVRFHGLGLAVIDEQHRFGVRQRAALWEKAERAPHVLVMTATPIPRTLAMTVWGDLDVSVIDQLPPGRAPIKTAHLYNDNVEPLLAAMRAQLEAGRQVYVVYPLVEESERIDLMDSERGYERLCKLLPQYRVARLHGRMRSEEKDAVMSEFAAGRVHVLVSTTVIEVGVDVPNATTIVIQHAERFGLAGLHQLRGRVGRGSAQGYCYLVTSHRLTDDGRRRIQTMVDTTDGFVIAEEDLRLRGPGDMEGTAQSGLWLELRAASLTRDADLMAVARDEARRLLEADPDESLPPYAVAWQQLRRLRGAPQDFSEIS